MVNIQWFPGHMTKAKRQIESKMPLIDVVAEVIDARIPFSSRNPLIDELAKDKARIVILNKIDLADTKTTELWEEYYKQKGYKVVKLNSTQKKGISKLVETAKGLKKNTKTFTTFKVKKERPTRMMIVGIPNVGKSTLINQLASKKITQVGNRPGVTRGQQWVSLANGLELLDTPGMLWPKFDDEQIALNLSVTGAIKQDILPKEVIATYAIEYLTKHYPKLLCERYSFDNCDSSIIDLFEQIGEKRSLYTHGGEIDFEQVYTVILTDLNQSRFGKISWEKPNT